MRTGNLRQMNVISFAGHVSQPSDLVLDVIVILFSVLTT